jgi:uncharacterized membrane protein YbhN (UPF0104 family)
VRVAVDEPEVVGQPLQPADIGSIAAAKAAQIVLIFRLLTFWLPAVVGILATRQLRRHGAL